MIRNLLLILSFSLLLFGNAYALKFEKCYAKWFEDKEAEELLTELELFGKFNKKKMENVYYQIYSDGSAERVSIRTDEGQKEESKRLDDEFKNSSYMTPKILQKMKEKIQTSKKKVVFANEDYIKLESVEFNYPNINPPITTLNLKNGEVSITSIASGDVAVIWQCEISRKGKSGLLDYWWALILIIAITFFVYTQSSSRLKKITIRKK